MVGRYDVSIRRTDLCAFEPLDQSLGTVNQAFQSVERICVPSNLHRARLAARQRVSIRRTDLCAFELPGRPQARVEQLVSIRRTDLCAFERSQLPS